jgi:flagellar hook-associated protein 1 FlgK
MSITGAMNNALTGLAAASRGASTVSNNLANALTDGYARRELDLSARSGTGGVQVNGEVRIINQTLLNDRRSSDADFARGEAQVDFLIAVQGVIGEPGSPMSLSDLMVDLETALVASAAQPQSGAMLEQGVGKLSQLVDRLAGTASAIQQERGRADSEIDNMVTRLNSDLSRIERLNDDIKRAVLRGESGGGLLDERQRLIDSVSEIVPIREVDRGNGVVALMSPGGILMDGPAPRISFAPATVVTADLSIGGGTLSGLSVNGTALDLGRDKHLLSGGRLEGLFAVRDLLGPSVQARLDGFARDLVERFEAGSVDPSRPSGSPGLLTDGGAAFDPAFETGLAGRLQVNPLVDPAQGGEAWRLRDGLGSSVPGNIGDASGLHRLSGALAELRSPASGGFPAGVRNASGLASDVLTSVGLVREMAESDAAYAMARSTALNDRLLSDGVDSDSEMQRLLLIEQSYAANARVISASQEMLDTLMRI